MGADRSAHDMACESHAISTAVQWSQEELLRNVTAIRDFTASTPAATAPQGYSQHKSAAGIQESLFLILFFFLQIYSCIWKYTLSDICLPVTATRMTHQKKDHISSAGAAAYLAYA